MVLYLNILSYYVIVIDVKARKILNFSGVQFVKELVETNAMKSIGATIYKKQFPGCENEIFDTKKYWECYVQHLTLSSYHPAGTCRIGHVVDQTFK